MNKFILFLLGQKGFKVLSAAVDGGFKNQLEIIVVGKDPQVQKDYSDEIIEFCKTHEIPFCDRKEFINSSINFEECIAFAAGWRWLIKDSFAQTLVFHDSLLPNYRGFNPLVTALLNKDAEIGVTALIANKDFDCGDIVGVLKAEVAYPIRIFDAIDLIADLYFDLAKLVFRKVIELGCLRGVQQDDALASYSVWRDEKDYHINWAWTADEIVHFINCLSYPYKGAYTMCADDLIRVHRAESLPDVKIVNRDIGKVLFEKNEQPVVICGSGLLCITEATDSQGRNALPFKQFRSRLY